MKYKFIYTNRLSLPVKKMCQIFTVSKSGYYKWVKNKPSKRTEENHMLLKLIKNIYIKNQGNYGSPRITKQLKIDGLSCSRNRIARIMQKNNIRSKTKKRFKITTKSKHNYPIAQNIINQDFTAKKLNEKWLSDITYIQTVGGWLYFSAIMGLYSRKIVGWSLGERLTREITIKALNNALTTRRVRNGLVIHSDRGVQYSCYDYTKLIRNNNFLQSMSGKGNCYDNAPMESFFKTLKVELIYDNRYYTRDEARRSIFEYVELYYNRKRLHSSIGYMSPVEFENSLN